MKLVMQDRPDLIQSELAGVAFDSLQQAFRAEDVDEMFKIKAFEAVHMEKIYIFIDPAAGGPQSDYCIITMTRIQGVATVIPIFQKTFRFSTVSDFLSIKVAFLSNVYEI
jgi:hypothetical protein